MSAQTVETKKAPKKKKIAATGMDEATRKSLMAVIEKAGIENVLLVTGQHVNRHAADVEDGFAFQKRAIGLARKVPELAR